ncbi:MAG: hypothetical protein IPL46_02175 [Saprospiraceae bacterium]|nr:hypothetical protein [Saprospiraceae bacterium]
MGIFDRLFRRKNKAISLQQKNTIANAIIELAKECTANLEKSNKQPPKNGKFEIFMLNLEFFTQQLLDRGYIKDEQDFRFLLVRKLMSDDENPIRGYTDQEFLEYYSSRTALIEYEISSLTKAMKSGGKMFIPVYSFTSIYKTPLVNEPDTSFADFEDLSKFDPLIMEEATDFLPKYGEHLNFIFTKINNIYSA